MNPPEGIEVLPEWWEDLTARYAQPPRVYHTISHVREVWDRWEEVDHAKLWVHRVETWIAVLLHDAVYVVGRSDNETKSAQAVREWCSKFQVSVDTSITERLILATADHHQHKITDSDTALFLDCDLAILGSPASRFREYEAQIKAEYAPHMPLKVYEAGRRSFLTNMAGRTVFMSDFFRDRREAQAKKNLSEALLC